MASVNSWRDLTIEVQEKFPNTEHAIVQSHVGDMTALMRHIAATHDLTFAEAAEVVTFRLPQFVEPERLSA